MDSMGDTAYLTQLSQLSLPTLDKLGVKAPQDVDGKAIANHWFQQFSNCIHTADALSLSQLVLEDVFWRDILALTWEFRTFVGQSKIITMLTDVLDSVQLTSLTLRSEKVGLEAPYPDLVWIQGVFSFETKVGVGNGVFRLVTTPSGDWKAHVISTELVELKGHPERIGSLRDFEPNHGRWPKQRHLESEFIDREPAVVIIGAGQSGLETAARLKMLDVPTLVLEKLPRIGDQWRNRYEALSLHDPVWYDHFAYMPFPPSWPVYAPAPKYADWQEFYASILELNVWTGCTISKIAQNETNSWTVSVTRADGTSRELKPRHIVFAHGTGGGVPKMPDIPGMSEFRGQILHSSKFKSARENVGKRVVVVGACTSAHDICMDHVEHGVDVTMFQRGPTYVMSMKKGLAILHRGRYWEGTPPAEEIDKIDVSYPYLLGCLLGVRLTKEIAEADKEILDGLRERGFKLTTGALGTGVVPLWFNRKGGYYLDSGGSGAIIDGRIKLANSSGISHFNENALVLEDGTAVPADVIVFATGYGDSKDLARSLIGDDVVENVGRVWGWNEEGELNSVWRWCGVQGLYFVMGNLALCRVHSKHLALQIKAQEEGLYGERYTKYL